MKQVLAETWASYRMHDGRLLSGALAFYVLLSVAPMGVIILALAGLVLGRQAKAGELVSMLSQWVSEDVAVFLSETIERASQPSHSLAASVLSAGFFAFAVTRLFNTLRMSLNHVWGVRAARPLGFDRASLRIVLLRLRALLTLLVAGLAVPAFAGLKTVISWANRYLGGTSWLLHAGELLFSVAVLTLLFGMIFRWLPDATIGWSDAFHGAAVTAALAGLGGIAVAAYLGRTGGGASSYGAAGSVVALLMWVYYMAQIFFLGAEFTRAWARHRGQGVEPRDYALSVSLHDPIAEELEPEEDSRPADLPADSV